MPPQDAIRYTAPSVRLRQLVTVLFTWPGVGQPYAGWMPSIGGQIAIRLDGWSRLTCLGAGDNSAAPPAALFGPLSRSAHLAVDQGFRSVGAGLTALGWQTLIGADAAIHADTACDLACVWGSRTTNDLLVHLLDAPSGHEAHALDAWLVRRLSHSHAVDRRIFAVEQWVQSGGSPQMLADLLELSPRQAERLTQRAFGMPPKVLAMRHRAMAAATRLTTRPDGQIGWHGYADQSHMIRDFRRFLGVTPGELTRQAALTRHILAEPERVGAQLFEGVRT